jgi:hypothetical protein
MQAVGLVLRARLRLYWKSWLALSALVALVGGLVMAAAMTARRTESAFPAYVAKYGNDAVIYSPHPLTRAQLPGVSRLTPVPSPFTVAVRCPSCRTPITYGDFAVLEVPPRALGHTVRLVSGRMPDQSDPYEVLASYSMAQDHGLRIGSVVHVLMPTKAEADQINEGGRPASIRGPRPALRVVGLVVAEREFPSANGSNYDLYPTAAFDRLVNPRTFVLSIYYIRLKHGAAGFPALSSQASALHTLGAQDVTVDAAAEQRAIHPQAVGWWALAALIALAGAAVAGQASARQAQAERGDHPALAALGLGTGQFAAVGLIRTALIGMAGAAGGVLLAVALSPLTPVGIARLADASSGHLTADGLVLPVGALATVLAFLALSVGPVLMSARRQRSSVARRTVPAAAVRAATGLGTPPSVLLGIRYALERGRGRDPVPVGTALLGMVLAVAALCATAVFGASLTHLLATPALYGTPFDAIFTNEGAGSGAAVTQQILPALVRDPHMAQVSEGSVATLTINGQHVTAIAVSAAAGRGPTLLSVVDGRSPRRDREITLGATTMRAVGARLGGLVRVTVADPRGNPHTSTFRVVGRASFSPSFATGGLALGTGSALSLRALADAECPAASSVPGCRPAVLDSHRIAILVRADPGPAGAAALARQAHRFVPYYGGPGRTPVELVNFGQSVSFPLLFGVALSVFGAATTIHLLLASVRRRRRETGLLKVLGLLRRQVAAIVSWQATTVAVAGIVVGVPLGIAVGRLAWRAFAVSFGVVPVSVVPAITVAGLAAAVLVAANLIAFVPALLAGRARAARLLRAE